jgi:CRP/FNR family cyclic AMP-dependent transcriptional regulator
VARESDVEAALARVDLFAGVSSRTLKKLAASGQLVDHPAGHQVVAEGRDGVGFHLILAGEMLIDVAGQHRPTLGVGDYFGEISLLDGKPRTATATAGPDGAKTWALTAWKFKPMLEEHPEICQPLLVTLCARLRAAEGSAAGRQA